MSQRATSAFLIVCALLLVSTIGLVGWPILRPFWQKYRPLQTPSPQQLAQAFPTDTRSVFENGDKFILLSLDPGWDYSGDNDFHGFRILGQTQLTDSAQRNQIRRAYYDGLTSTGFTAACFSPRHGIRVGQGKRRVDLVICFKCGSARIFIEGEENLKGPGAYGQFGYARIGARPRATFDHILQNAGVPLAS